MSWISDVITRTTITSVWGNAIRDRVVHTFDSHAERDAHPSLPNGVVCFTADDNLLWRKVGGAWWPLLPVQVTGTPVAADVTIGQTKLVASITLPAGFRTASMAYNCLIDATDAARLYDGNVTLNAYRGTTLVGRGQWVWTVDAVRSVTQLPFTANLNLHLPIANTGDSLHVDLVNNGGQPLAFTVRTVGDGTANTLTAMCFP